MSIFGICFIFYFLKLSACPDTYTGNVSSQNVKLGICGYPPRAKRTFPY